MILRQHIRNKLPQEKALGAFVRWKKWLRCKIAEVL
jgi:hypothetical protein